MRRSQMLIPTLKENPREAEIPSHRLMLRAGMIKKLTSGIYTFLPLGFRVLKNIERIVREEMNAIGCQEIFMPIMHPAEIYEESGRLNSFGPELFKLNDSRKRLFALGPTHEEVITMIARDDMRSYRSLPQCMYQIQTKFRDEIRPRYGIVRAREFIMKDAYSFHSSDDSLDRTYRAMDGAYEKIIRRCQLDFRKVEADSGYIGGNESLEFMVLAGNGESELLSCACGYGVNRETATPLAKESRSVPDDPDGCYEPVETPGKTTVEEVSKFMKVEPCEVVKTLLYKSGDRDIAVLVPGDREINDIKLVQVIGDREIRFLEPAEVELLTGGPVGFSGPVGLPDGTEIYADLLIKNYKEMIVGANEGDRHLKGVRPGNDFSIDHYADIVWAREKDLCPICNKPLELFSGVEVGHIFKLGTKYSTSMNATYLDEHGENHPFIMGCYGFGVSRMVAAAIEQHHDEDGIIWPMSIAPFKLLILPINVSDREVMETAVKLEAELADKGIEVLMDDRDSSPGVKFKDADLMGIPLRINIGKKLKDGLVELCVRESKETIEASVDDVARMVMNRIES